MKETLNYADVIAKDTRQEIKDLPTIMKNREAWRRAVNSIWAAAADDGVTDNETTVATSFVKS